MRIALIVATDLDGVIGRDNDLPWRLPADLRRFRKLTMGKPILMGRKTHDSIGLALPGRRNIVITRQLDYRAAEGCEVVHSFEAALEAAGEDTEEVMVIGGAAIYAEALPQADRLYLTTVQAHVEGDTYFPELDLARWSERSREECPADDKNSYSHLYRVLDRA